jgi:SAM-dependent methyltransferase
VKLIDLIQRGSASPWVEGDNIPWDEPEFSERMLKEHLSQNHDAASRKSETIDDQVAWINRALLNGQPARVLDLGCGPGLYTSRLARLGCTCHGIDFSPASIRYARETAAREGLACTYDQCDVRKANFGQDYDLGMFIFGEFNVFKPDHARQILRSLHTAIKTGGQLLLEISPLAAIRRMGQASSSWYTSPAGLFSELPYICLEESFWDEASRAATTRYYIVAAESGEVTRHASTYQGYDEDEIESLLDQVGFDDIRFYPALGIDNAATPPGEFIAISAVRA